MSARVRSAGLACALALTGVACGSDDSGWSPAPPASEAGAPSPAETRASDEAPAVAEPAAPPAPAPSAELEDRVGEILDTETTGEGLDQLIRSAREERDPAAREAAVIALGDSDDPRALDALIAASEDPDARVVLAAIDQLSWIDDRRAEDAIRRLVDSPNPEIADTAREELEE